MPIYVEKLSDEPIVTVTVTEPVVVKHDIPALNYELSAVFDASPVRVWAVMIVKDPKMEFGELVRGMAMVTRGEVAALTHPNAAGFAVVTTHDMFRLAASALKQAQYGEIKVSVYLTQEEALASVRQKIVEHVS